MILLQNKDFFIYCDLISTFWKFLTMEPSTHIRVCFALTSFAYLNMSIIFNCVTFVFYVFSEIKVFSNSWKLHSCIWILSWVEKSQGQVKKVQVHQFSTFSTNKKLFTFIVISSYLGHLQVRFSSIKVLFHIPFFFKDALGNAREEP